MDETCDGLSMLIGFANVDAEFFARCFTLGALSVEFGVHSGRVIATRPRVNYYRGTEL